MRVLIKNRDHYTCTSYRVEDTDQVQAEVNSIVIPDGESVGGYLEKLYPGRVKAPSDAEIERRSYYHQVNIFNHHWLEEYTSLPDLLLRVEAHGTVLLSDVTELRDDLESQGLGKWDENCKLQAFCNGLVFERSPEGIKTITMDPKRAARILSGRAKRSARKMPAKARERQLKMRDIIDFGVNIRDFVWDKFRFDDLKYSCISGGGYKTFRAGSWDRAIGSLYQILSFIKHNKINLNVPKFKQESETKDKELVRLLAKNIKKLRLQTASGGSVDNKTDIQVLSHMRRILIQCQS